jgi:preprotein translocase subunit SecD
MDEPSASEFASYTASHLDDQVAFIRNGVVVFATKITQPINSPSIEISAPEMTAEKADNIVRLLRQSA